MSEKIVPIRGHRIDLDDTRAVFLGYAKGDDTNYVKFFNGDQVIALKISSEAIRALARLERGNIKGAKKVTDKDIVKEPVAHWVPVEREGDAPAEGLFEYAARIRKPARRKKLAPAASAAEQKALVRKISKRIAKKLTQRAPAKRRAKKKVQRT